MNNVDPTLTFTNRRSSSMKATPSPWLAWASAQPTRVSTTTPWARRRRSIGATVDWGDGSTADPLTVGVGVRGGVAGHSDDRRLQPRDAPLRRQRDVHRHGQLQGRRRRGRRRTFTIVVNNVAAVADADDRRLRDQRRGHARSFRTWGRSPIPGSTTPPTRNGATEESFKYTINWGDGTPRTSAKLPAPSVD